MASTSSNISLMPFYNFGLNEQHFSSIPPLFYFFSKTIEGILFPPQPFTPRLASNSDRLRPASIDTCSPTEPQEISIYNDHRRTIDAWHAVVACLLVILVRYTFRLSEDKWNMSSRQGRWSYRLYWADQIRYLNPRLTPTWAPILVPSYNDYCLTQRHEAIRVLSQLMISACLCPIAEYFFCTRERVSERWYNNAHGNTVGEVNGPLEHGLFLIYMVLRYGILPWFATTMASGLIIPMILMLGYSGEVERPVLAWHMWIREWINAHQVQNAETTSRYMAVLKDLDPAPPHTPRDYKGLYSVLPELTFDLTWHAKYQEFLSSEYFAGST